MKEEAIRRLRNSSHGREEEKARERSKSTSAVSKRERKRRKLEKFFFLVLLLRGKNTSPLLQQMIDVINRQAGMKGKTRFGTRILILFSLQDRTPLDTLTYKPASLEEEKNSEDPLDDRENSRA